MHRPLYPPGHKKAGQRKADKDLTPAEIRTQEDQVMLYDGYKRAAAERVVGKIADAHETLGK